MCLVVSDEGYLYLLGSFTQDFIADELPEFKAGEGYDFSFPNFDPNYASPVTVGTDIEVMLCDTPVSWCFRDYLPSGRA